ncbi:putative outer membrane protein [Labilithrix luteola]|uniref:Putative outer membrane protein n=1 Tax=Labilithrix luteola TaxID=1391654 RepID=A0A0K1PLW4_9BACT|nr:DUF481 domain-containing protein [Labilithrix luteola]AKU94512.1 putative outer membrane protein [Labilithrix luteola]
MTASTYIAGTRNGRPRVRRPIRSFAALLALIGAFVVLTWSPKASAQVNAEALRLVLRDHAQFVWFDASLVGRAGNTQTTNFGASLFGGIKREPHVFFVRAAVDYGQSQGTTNVDRWVAHARYNYDLSRLLALEALVQEQHDTFRRMALRGTYGLGVRFRFIETDDLEVFYGATFILEQDVVSSTDTEPLETELFERFGNYVGINAWLNPLMRATAVLYAQPRIADWGDFRILHEASISFQITKLLAAKISGSVYVDTEPPSTVLPYDVEVKNSIELRLF